MSQQQFPREAYALGDAYNLGKPLAIYRTHYARAAILFFWTQVALALLSMLVGIGFLMALIVFHEHVTKLFLPVMLALFALNIATISRAPRAKGLSTFVPFTQNLRVYVYENGLVRLQKMHDQKPLVVRWHEIRDVRILKPSDERNSRGFQPSVRLLRKKGKTLVFSANIEHVVELGEMAKHGYKKFALLQDI